MYYQTRLIVLDAISEMKFNLMESSIKIAIFSFFFSTTWQKHSRHRLFVILIRPSSSPSSSSLHVFCATVLEKACIRKTIPPLLRSISFLSS